MPQSVVECSPYVEIMVGSKMLSVIFSVTQSGIWPVVTCVRATIVWMPNWNPSAAHIMSMVTVSRLPCMQQEHKAMGQVS
jgi:hypothetical protein